MRRWEFIAKTKAIHTYSYLKEFLWEQIFIEMLLTATFLVRKFSIVKKFRIYLIKKAKLLLQGYIKKKYNILMLFIEFVPTKEIFIEKQYFKIPDIIPKNGVALDVGATYGEFSFFISKNSEKIFAFEPNPIFFRGLKKNILVNNLSTKIIPFKFAVSSFNGRAKFYLEDETIESNFSKKKSYKVVKAVKLDDFVKKQNLKKIDLIKIDVEGGELNVLKGARNILKKFHPVLLMEIHSLKLKHKIERLLSRFGYKKVYDKPRDSVPSKNMDLVSIVYFV